MHRLKINNHYKSMEEPKNAKSLTVGKNDKLLYQPKVNCFRSKTKKYLLPSIVSF